jgi:hypothetical protein
MHDLATFTSVSGSDWPCAVLPVCVFHEADLFVTSGTLQVSLVMLRPICSDFARGTP